MCIPPLPYNIYIYITHTHTHTHTHTNTQTHTHTHTHKHTPTHTDTHKHTQLLEAGAVINAQTDMGERAIHVAIRNADLRVLKALS